MLLERVRDLSGVEVPGDPFYAGREAKAISNALAVADDRAPLVHSPDLGIPEPRFQCRLTLPN
ncbi:hypothetical protein B0E55_06354 [Rhodococcus sp. 66b]|nr:hypothetical protein B0E55_06354 [Rhodococcus sp. 66b]